MAAAHFSSVWVLVFLALLSLCFGGTVSISQQNLEVHKRLKQLNKPPLKSIKSPDGDIIDCVHISHQPAFDHPLLKNHTIQVRPSYHPEGLINGKKVSIPQSNEGKSKPITQVWHLNGKCPEGTIPIRRTKAEDLLRTSSVQRYGMKKHRSIPKPAKPADSDLVDRTGHEYAVAYVDGEFYGAKATINVWNPKIQQPDEFSLSQLWVLGGSDSDLNSIEAGWQVFEQLYRDNNTRLFIYWTIDGYKTTGCYNLCPGGFIQTSNEIAIGASISPVSAYSGSQHDISILVWKDPKDGNWWMQYENDVLGYWPVSLFSYLAHYATRIEWGGEVVNKASDGQHTTTQMGSGHFPSEGFGKASYFKNIEIVDGSNNLAAPKDIGTIPGYRGCYDIQVGKTGDGGNYFYYGGPGRNPNCAEEARSLGARWLQLVCTG